MALVSKPCPGRTRILYDKTVCDARRLLNGPRISLPSGISISSSLPLNFESKYILSLQLKGEGREQERRHGIWRAEEVQVSYDFGFGIE